VTEQVAELDREQIERLAEWFEQVGEALEQAVEAFERFAEVLREVVVRFVAAVQRWTRQELIVIAVLDGSPWWLKVKPWYQRVVRRAVEWLPDRVAGWLLPVVLRFEARHWGVAL